MSLSVFSYLFSANTDSNAVGYHFVLLDFCRHKWQKEESLNLGSGTFHNNRLVWCLVAFLGTSFPTKFQPNIFYPSIFYLMQRLKIEPQADLNSNRNMCRCLLALH